jgi:hypothetical protein
MDALAGLASRASGLLPFCFGHSASSLAMTLDRSSSCRKREQALLHLDELGDRFEAVARFAEVVGRSSWDAAIP